jgi:pyroglutamyl-peptidase
MKNLIVTGFGPFPGAPFNISREIVKGLAISHPSVRLIKHLYETRYAAVDEGIEQIFLSAQPAAVISLGIGHPGVLRLEKVARNHGTLAHPDASGAVWHGPIDSAGPNEIASTLPLAAIHQRLDGEGHDPAYSSDAGGYVCNYAFYRTAIAAQRSGRDIAVGFIHVPPIDEHEAGGALAQSINRAIHSVANLIADWMSERAAA